MKKLLSSYTPHLLEVGTDEVGRGCLAGPVVAAAVILPKNFYHPLLTDSKQLGPADRALLNEYIQNSAISFHVTEIDNLEIDKMNILNASIKAMHVAISHLKVSPELILVDGNRFIPYPSVPHVCIVKGDSKYSSIAAASILAKEYRDAIMKKYHSQFPQYDWIHNVGYPTAKHRQAIREHGICALHRKSFKLF